MGNTPSINDKKGSTYDAKGYNGYGFHHDTHLHGETKTLYNKSGLNYRGFDKHGIHEKTGESEDDKGFDAKGWKHFWEFDGICDTCYYHRCTECKHIKTLHCETMTIWDPEGFNYKGYNKDRFNRRGFYYRSNIHRLTGTHFDPNGYYVDGKHQSELVFTECLHGKFDQFHRRFGDLRDIRDFQDDGRGSMFR
jgi:hypothetical protein